MPKKKPTTTPITTSDLVGGHVLMPDETERPILPNAAGRWSDNPEEIVTLDVAASRLAGLPAELAAFIHADLGRLDGTPIGYAALLAPLASTFPLAILPEPPITEAEWSAMIEAIKASDEEEIALAVPASCFNEFTLPSPDPDGEPTLCRSLVEPRLREVAEALRVTACRLGVALTF